MIKETTACERYPKHRVTSKNTTHSESIVDIASLSQNFNCALVSAASVSFSPGCTAVMRGGALKDNRPRWEQRKAFGSPKYVILSTPSKNWPYHARPCQNCFFFSSGAWKRCIARKAGIGSGMLEPTWLIIAEPEMCRNALPTLQSSITGTYQARHWLPPQADQWCFSTAPRSAAH